MQSLCDSAIPSESASAASAVSVTNDNDVLWTIAQVAEFLACSEMVVRRWRNGKIAGPKFVQIGPKQIRYRPADVRAWISAQADKSEPEPVVGEKLYSDLELSRLGYGCLAKLRRQRSNGTGIPFVYQGGSVRYRESDIQKWLDENRRTFALQPLQKTPGANLEPDVSKSEVTKAEKAKAESVRPIKAAKVAKTKTNNRSLKKL